MERNVTVTGHGAVAVVPDRATVRLAVTCRADSVADALAGVAATSATLGEVARRSTEGRFVRSTGVNVWPRHDDQGRLAGAEASQQFRVRCPDPVSASTMIAACAEELGETLRVDGFDLEVGDPSAALAQAREAAFADARSKAEQLAALGEARLGELVAVVEGAGRPGAVVEQAMAMRAAAVPVEVGESTVEQALQVTWRLL